VNSSCRQRGMSARRERGTIVSRPRFRVASKVKMMASRTSGNQLPAPLLSGLPVAL
jgi:hypothetical protein